MSEEEKKLLIYDAEDNQYYNIFNFVDYLTKGADEHTTREEYETFLELVYIVTKHRLEFLTGLYDLYEKGVVERQVEDEFGKLRSLTEEESKLQDKEMKETIEGLSNTIDEYNFFFEDERIERLEGEVANYWTEIEDLST